MRKSLLITALICISYLLLSPIGKTNISVFSSTKSEILNAQQLSEFTSLGCNVSVRVGQVFAGETNYIIASNPPDSNNECNPKNLTKGVIQVFRPGLETITIEPPASSKLKLVDVTDLNNDGIDEIIAVNDVANVSEDNLAAFFIYSASKPQQPLVFLPGRQKQISSQERIAEHISVNHIKIYQLTNGKRVVVVATDVAGTNFDGIVHFYQLDREGLIKDNPQTLFSPCKDDSLKCRVINDALDFPMIAVDDLDNDGFKEVVIMPKAKVLVFQGDSINPNEIGKPLYYTQYVDPQGEFNNYNVFRDYGGEFGIVGYRYGQMQIVRDLDNDGIKDLIVMADALREDLYYNGQAQNTQKPYYPDAVLQAFKLQSPKSASGGYLKPLGPLTYPNLSPSFTGVFIERANRFINSILGDPPVGGTVNSIQDVNGDGFPEVVISGYQSSSQSSYQSNKPFVDIYTFKVSTGWQKIKRLKGTCLDVTSLDNSSLENPPDIIIWNKLDSKIDIWRWQTNANKFTLLSEPIFARTWPSLQDSTNFALSSNYGEYEKHGSSSDFHSLMVINSRTGKTFIQNEKLTFAGCGSIKGWNTNNRQINQVLDMESLPGKIMTLSNKTSTQSNSEIIFNMFENCNKPSGVIRPYTQENSQLVPKF